MITTLLH